MSSAFWRVLGYLRHLPGAARHVTDLQETRGGSGTAPGGQAGYSRSKCLEGIDMSICGSVGTYIGVFESVSWIPLLVISEACVASLQVCGGFGCFVHMQICLTMGGLFPPDWCTRTLGALRSLGLTLHVQTNLHMSYGSGTSQTGLSYCSYVTGMPVHGKQSGASNVACELGRGFA